jgi:hypothetical protein
MIDEMKSLVEERKQTRPIVLLQGYPYTGFARFDADKGLCLPLQDISLQKPLYWDIRIFSPEGEWHLWKRNAKGEWGKRFAPANEWRFHIERIHRLWGGSAPQKEGDWFRYQETNGARVYLPVEIRNPALKVHARIQRDLRGSEGERTNLAGIVDAMICAIVEVS